MEVKNKEEKKDIELVKRFKKRFNKVIIFKNRNTGKLGVFVRSKTDVMIDFLTDQTELEEITIETEPVK